MKVKKTKETPWRIKPTRKIYKEFDSEHERCDSKSGLLRTLEPNLALSASPVAEIPPPEPCTRKGN